MSDYLSYDSKTNKSEVARLRAHIELECQALHHLTLPSVGASHEMISARYRSLDSYSQQLETLVGKEEAMQVTVSIYNTIV